MTPRTFQVRVLDKGEWYHWSDHSCIQDAADAFEQASDFYREDQIIVWRIDWPEGDTAGMLTDVTADALAYLEMFREPQDNTCNYCKRDLCRCDDAHDMMEAAE